MLERKDDLEIVPISTIQASENDNRNKPALMARASGVVQSHVNRLQRDITQEVNNGNPYGLTTPIDIISLNGDASKTFVVDGHHRLLAISKHNDNRAKHGIITEVPAWRWTGDVSDAYQLALVSNKHIVIPREAWQQRDLAWQAISSPHTSHYRDIGVRQAEKALSISRPTISNMRRVLAEFSPLHHTHPDQSFTEDEHMAAAVIEIQSLGTQAWS